MIYFIGELFEFLGMVCTIPATILYDIANFFYSRGYRLNNDDNTPEDEQ